VSVGRAGTAPPRCYWVDVGTLLAGVYPGHADLEIASTRLATLLDLGITWFVDLTWPGELPPYEALLPGPFDQVRRNLVYSRRPIRDHGVPSHAAQMVEILDEIEDALSTGHRVYVHCRGGIGRTGTVIGCLLARRSRDGGAALVELNQLWVAAGRDRDWPGTPETDEQVAYVRGWRDLDRPAKRVVREAALPRVEVTDVLRGRFRGLMLGLALADALAAPVQHRRPGTFTPVGDLTGGGSYDLPRGAWSDDTAQALLLADSLLACGAYDARDFVERLGRWQRDGYLSATGQCIGISATTARAIAQARWTGNPFAGTHDPGRAEKEPLVRAGVAAAWALSDPEQAIELAVQAARPTHQAPVALDACRYFTALCIGALQGASRAELLAPGFSPVPGLWQRRPLKREVAAVADGGWREAGANGSPGPIADGTAADALGLVLWALARGSSYRDTVLAAINLGLDADSNGALVGQLAGALYGASGLPSHWVSGLAQAGNLGTTADRLLAAALTRIAGV
jgi:ADP-ribosyl-[dinitrogen reductase] hydrolase